MFKKNNSLIILFVLVLVILFLWLNLSNTKDKPLTKSIGIERGKDSGIEPKKTETDYQYKEKALPGLSADVRKNEKPREITDYFYVEHEEDRHEDWKTNYRYKDDPAFDIDQFVGPVNENNITIRNELFSRKNHEVVEQQLTNGDYDPINSTVVQFENMIDYNLGIDFPEEKRAKIRNSQREMLSKRSTLDDLLNQGKITLETHEQKSKEIFGEALQNIAKITTDEEFEILYQIKKEEIPQAYTELITPPYE